MQTKMRIDVAATSARLQAKWKRAGVTQEVAAAQIGMSQEHLGRLLAGNFRRDSENLERLCAFLNVKRIFLKQELSLARYPKMERCLAELMDGSRKRERAVVRLLRSAQAFMR